MCQLKNDIEQGRIFKGRRSGGSTPTPPPSIFRFSLKSEGKEVKKKERNKMREGGLLYSLLTYFLG